MLGLSHRWLVHRVDSPRTNGNGQIWGFKISILVKKHAFDMQLFTMPSANHSHELYPLTDAISPPKKCSIGSHWGKNHRAPHQKVGVAVPILQHLYWRNPTNVASIRFTTATTSVTWHVDLPLRQEPVSRMGGHIFAGTLGIPRAHHSRPTAVTRWPVFPRRFTQVTENSSRS